MHTSITALLTILLIGGAYIDLCTSSTYVGFPFHRILYGRIQRPVGVAMSRVGVASRRVAVLQFLAGCEEREAGPCTPGCGVC